MAGIKISALPSVVTPAYTDILPTVQLGTTYKVSNTQLAGLFGIPVTVGASGTLLRSNGTSWVASTSTFADTYAINSIPYASAANNITALAPVLSAVLVSSAASTGVPTWVGPLTNGQLIVGSTGAIPVAATLTAGTGVSITNAAGSITVNVSGGGLAWVGIAGTTQAAAINTGYVIQNSSQTTVTLPATAVLGSVVSIRGLGSAGWIMAANTGQTINVDGQTTSSGGTLTSSGKYDSIDVTCVIANTTWIASSVISTGLTYA